MQHTAWLVGCALHADSRNRIDVKASKDLMTDFINQSVELIIVGCNCAFPLGEEVPSILIPIALDDGKPRLLKDEEAFRLNCVFNYTVFNNLNGEIQSKLSVDGSGGIYDINFSDPQISHCVMNL
jgi:uncharacterized protein YbaR (Trm112 family)